MLRNDQACRYLIVATIRNITAVLMIFFPGKGLLRDTLSAGKNCHIRGECDMTIYPGENVSYDIFPRGKKVSCENLSGGNCHVTFFHGKDCHICGGNCQTTFFPLESFP